MRDETNAYLDGQFTALREAISSLNDDHIIAIVWHVRTEMGVPSAQRVVQELLHAARNPLTDPTAAACIQTALARYDAD